MTWLTTRNTDDLMRHFLYSLPTHLFFLHNIRQKTTSYSQFQWYMLGVSLYCTQMWIKITIQYQWELPRQFRKSFSNLQLENCCNKPKGPKMTSFNSKSMEARYKHYLLICWRRETGIQTLSQSRSHACLQGCLTRLLCACEKVPPLKSW